MPGTEQPSQASDFRHVLVLLDRSSGFQPLPGSANLRYDDAPETSASTARMHSWKTTQRVRRQVFTLRDQHFELAGTDARRPLRILQTGNTVRDSVPLGSQSRPLKIKPLSATAEPLEWYEHNTGFARRFEGDRLNEIFDDHKRQAQLAQEEATAGAIWIEGKTSYTHLAPGFKFIASNLREKDGTYVLSRVVQRASQGGVRSAHDAPFTHECEFVCVPEALPVRPPRKTPKPRIEGLQTAVVAGLADAGIDVDVFGRVKVQFYWDRADQYNQDSSCWVRVSQLWAGNRWGAFFWPRPGMEVLVSFEDGDPDRPIITGCVYNAANMPPANLPRESALSGFKSCSAGSALGPNNALVFYDSPGAEHVFQHSPRDEARINRGVNYRCSEGPEIAFVGGPISMPGSGSGGGLSALFAGMGEYAFKQGLPGAPKRDTDWDRVLGGLNVVVPKKAEFATGNALSASITGTKASHSLFTRKWDFTCSDDIESMARALGLDIGWIKYITRAVTGLSPLPAGASIGLFSNNLKQDYWGVSYAVERKGKETKHVGGPLMKSGFGKGNTPNPQFVRPWVAGVWTSLGVVTALVVATDVLIILYNRKFAELEAEKAELKKPAAKPAGAAPTTTSDAGPAKPAPTADEKTKEVEASQSHITMILQFLTLAGQIAIPIAHFIFYKLEATYADLSAVRKKFKETEDKLDAVTKMIAKLDAKSLKAREAELKDMLTDAKKAIGVGKNIMMDMAATTGEAVDSALDGYVQKDYVAGLSVAGPTVDVVAEQDKDDAGTPREGAGRIRLTALGATAGNREGVIALQSDGKVTTRVRTAIMGLNGKTDAGKTEAYITAGAADEIRFTKSTGGVTDPASMGRLSITMTGKAIELRSELYVSDFSSIKVEPDGITISSGKLGTPTATFKLTASEISSAIGATSQLKQSASEVAVKIGTTEGSLKPDGAKLTALKTEATSQLNTKTQTTQQQSQAQIASQQDTMVKIGG